MLSQPPYSIFLAKGVENQVFTFCSVFHHFPHVGLFACIFHRFLALIIMNFPDKELFIPLIHTSLHIIYFFAQKRLLLKNFLYFCNLQHHLQQIVL